MTTRRSFLQGAAALFGGVLLPGVPAGWKRKSFRVGFGDGKVQGIVVPDRKLEFYAWQETGGAIGHTQRRNPTLLRVAMEAMDPATMEAYSQLFDNGNKGPGSYRHAVIAREQVFDLAVQRIKRNKRYDELRGEGLSKEEAFAELRDNFDAVALLARSADPLDRLKLIGMQPEYAQGVAVMLDGKPNRNGDIILAGSLQNADFS